MSEEEEPASKRYKSYEAKFKLEVVSYAKSTNNRAASLKYQVSRSRVIDWRRKEVALMYKAKSSSTSNRLTAEEIRAGEERKEEFQQSTETDAKPTGEVSEEYTQLLYENSYLGMATKRKLSDSPTLEAGVIMIEPEVEEDEEDDSRLYCICRRPNDESKPMIACDYCDEWYHAECLGVDEDELENLNEFHCGRCPKNKDLSTTPNQDSPIDGGSAKRIKTVMTPKYDEETMKHAVTQIKLGNINLNKAANLYQLPRSTLRRRMKSNGEKIRAIGGITLLSIDEEKALADHVEAEQNSAERPLTRKEIRHYIIHLLSLRGEDGKEARVNLVNRPGANWFRRFYSKYPHLKIDPKTGAVKTISPKPPTEVVTVTSATPMALPGGNLHGEHVVENPYMLPVYQQHLQNGAMMYHHAVEPHRHMHNGHTTKEVIVGQDPQFNSNSGSLSLLELHGAVVSANHRIQGHVLHTPLIESFELQKLVDNKVYLKLENEQLTGSFKLRGAFNKLCKLQENSDAKNKSPITASSGNHALACVYAMKKLGMTGTVFVPTTVSPAKEEALRARGADVVKFGTDCVEGERKARQTAKEEDRLYISPYNDYDIIAGNGTIGFEILDDLPDVDFVLVPVGGGGMIAGIAAYIKAENPSCKVIGCQPINSKVMYESVKAGKIIYEESKDTLSDGTAGGIEEDSVTFKPCQQYVDDWILTSEEDIAKGIKFMVDKHHKIIEGAAGTAIGGYMANAHMFRGKTVAIVVCGANISTQKLVSVLKP